MRRYHLHIDASENLTPERLAVVAQAFMSRSDSAAHGGFLSADSLVWAQWWMERHERRSLRQRIWAEAWFRPVRYLLTLRARLIRRPLRTGRILGITVMSFVDEPHMTRLP